MKQNITPLLSVVLLFVFTTIQCIKAQNSNSFRVMFYNTENLFDPWDDTTSLGDNEFLPEGSRHWNFTRYKTKINNIAKTILAAGEWQSPMLVGLCEIENPTVLKHLIYWTGLSELNYRFIHFESPDLRGIDVALLYRSNCFTPIESRPVTVTLPDQKPTRDILLIKGVTNLHDTLFVMVNHWPSRLGGAQASEIKRVTAANMLLSICDSIRSVVPNASIVVMGDFNDSPKDNSIQGVMEQDFFNLAKIQENKNQGTNKYRLEWESIDQIMISNSMKAKMQEVSFKVVNLPFLLIKDEVNMGEKLFRTYVGPRYLGGFSDHLPVMATFVPKP